MNAFGIDHGRGHTAIFLREGRGAHARLRSVGDGSRQLIPNAVAAGGLWGSRAALASEPHGGGAVVKDLRDDEAGTLGFWRGVAGRLYAYLGRVRPSLANGYQVVVALPAGDFHARARAVRSACEQSGLDDVSVIPSTHALLSRWLVEASTEAAAGLRTVAVVAAGDGETDVAAYAVRGDGGASPNVVASSSAVCVAGAGHAAWAARVVALARSRLRESDASPRAGLDFLLNESALRFGSLLSRAKEGEEVAWSDAFSGRLYSPLRLTRAEMRKWPEVARLYDELPDAIRRVALEVGKKATPGVVLIGGVGAVWPFPAEAGRGLARGVWRSVAPAEDVARGAAWWPESRRETDNWWDAETAATESRPPDGRESQAPDATEDDVVTALFVDEPRVSREAVEEYAPAPVEESSTEGEEDADLLPPWERY